MAISNEAEPTGTEGQPGDLPESQDCGSYDYFESTCSTPYVSAPSSPGRLSTAASSNGYFFSCPTSPMHFFSTAFSGDPPLESDHFLERLSGTTVAASTDFEFSSRLVAAGPNSGSSSPAMMISADELFLNGQIRPMRLPSHLQKFEPSLSDVPKPDGPSDLGIAVGDATVRGRDFRSQNRSLRRRTRSLSPLRNSEPGWPDFPRQTAEEEESKPADPPPVAAVARRSSRRWMSLKDFLYRSKSEGRGYVKEKLSWSALSFSSPSKERKASATAATARASEKPAGGKEKKKKASGRDGTGKRRIPAPSAHELHYTAMRAQAEEMRKRTYLPYRQGLLGCLGFSSRSYSVVSGLAKTLHHHHPVPSR